MSIEVCELACEGRNISGRGDCARCFRAVIIFFFFFFDFLCLYVVKQRDTRCRQDLGVCTEPAGLLLLPSIRESEIFRARSFSYQSPG